MSLSKDELVAPRQARGEEKRTTKLLILSLSKDGGALMCVRALEKSPHMKIFVYILRCRDGSYYVGLTRAGLDKRLAEHQSGDFSGYTSSRRPVTLVWSDEFQWLMDAIAC